MSRLMPVVAMAMVVAFVSPALSAEESEAEAPATLEKEETKWFEAGFDTDLFSAYVFRNAIINDELVIEPCVWLDMTLFDLLTVGGNVWQNWNLTNRQRDWGIPNEMNETDYNVHINGNIWETDDEEYSLCLELAHDWFTYRYDLDCENELALRLDFNNPFVGVYGKYSQAYYKESCCHFELGLSQEWNVGEIFESESDYLNRLSVGFDWNLNFASGRFFSNYVYGQIGRGRYDPEVEEYEDYENLSNGIGGTTIQGNVAYEVCENFTIGFVLAFTSTLSGEVREYLDQTYGDRSFKDLVWGGLQAKLSF